MTDWETQARAGWLERGYEMADDGKLTKIGATILEVGTRVVIRDTFYVATIVGGDFCGGTEYVIEPDYTGLYRPSYLARQTNRAEALLTGVAAIEHLAELGARSCSVEERAQAADAILRLELDAEKAREMSLRGGHYRADLRAPVL
jgi:hypothetical protein